jgi:hypothetical protein
MSDSEMDRGESPVEDYLDELLSALRGDPRDVRHQLAEAEAHLWDATDEGVAAGLERVEAERQAVARFGSADALAGAELRRQSVSWWLLTRQGVMSAIWLGAVAAIAVGLSGLVAALVGGVWGSRFLVTTPTSADMTASACTRWMHGSHALSCAQAAMADWSFEVVGYRIALGILGLLALGLWYLLRRRTRGARLALPAVVVDTVAVVAFGAAGLWLVGQGLDTVVVASGHGAGQWLSAAPVALAAAAAFGWHLARTLRQPA